MSLQEFKSKLKVGFTRKELMEGIEVEGRKFFVEIDRNGRYWNIYGKDISATRCRIDTIYNKILEVLK